MKTQKKFNTIDELVQFYMTDYMEFPTMGYDSIVVHDARLMYDVLVLETNIPSKHDLMLIRAINRRPDVKTSSIINGAYIENVFTEILKVYKDREETSNDN